MDPTTRLIDLTVGELQAIISHEVERRMAGLRIPAQEQKEQPAEKPLYGLAGIAEALHCSTRRAQRMKSEGLLEGGYQQIGSKIIVRSPQMLRDIAEHSVNKKKRKNNR